MISTKTIIKTKDEFDLSWKGECGILSCYSEEKKLPFIKFTSIDPHVFLKFIQRKPLEIVTENLI